MLPSTMNVTLAISNKSLLDKVTSIISSFKDVGLVKNVKDYQELMPELEKTDKNLFFVIDLTSETFSAVTAKAQDIVTDHDKNVIFIVNDDQKTDEKYSAILDNVIGANFKLIELSSLISDLKSETGSDNFPIPINNFYKVTAFPCDIFVKLGVDKYVKIANEKDPVDDNFIQKFKAKRVDSFYVKSHDFYDKCTALFSDKLADVKLFDTKEEYVRKSQEILHGMVKDLGVNEFIVSKVNETLASVEKELQKPNLKKVFNLFEKMKGTFIYDHSYLTMMFCNILCKHMDWESEQVRSKLAMASMFHDLGMANPKKAFYEGAGKSKITTMDQELSQEILDHGRIIAEMLQADKEMPQEVINICLNHHEGLGPEESYPRGLTGTNLTQLECVFIVAHDFVLELYKIAFNTSKIQKAYDAVAQKYTSGNFKAIMKAFEVALEEEIKPSI
ncbi:HD domain-containing protein [Bacteriovorax sp. DB6_IX]|uniref:HD domain-containing protein n=1 Tax=Bacteriovorax sp. DB6_IX TaxID=1353530 RepID=UPI00038A1F70|nr:HD domain-containing protein [Bacteriovorax sp. DB6_IX]EQC50429.1 HD domain protein [Bacteriovorax sp. DB6_IX]